MKEASTRTQTVWTLHLPQSLLCKCMSRSGLEIPFEFDRPPIVMEADVGCQFPRPILRSVRGPAGIMRLKSCVDILRNPDITLIGERETLQEVHVLHTPPFAKASGGSLRPKAGVPAEALAKAGGGQDLPPSLVSMLRVEILGRALVA